MLVAEKTSAYRCLDRNFLAFTFDLEKEVLEELVCLFNAIREMTVRGRETSFKQIVESMEITEETDRVRIRYLLSRLESLLIIKKVGSEPNCQFVINIKSPLLLGINNLIERFNEKAVSEGGKLSKGKISLVISLLKITEYPDSASLIPIKSVEEAVRTSRECEWRVCSEDVRPIIIMLDNLGYLNITMEGCWFVMNHNKKTALQAHLRC